VSHHDPPQDNQSHQTGSSARINDIVALRVKEETLEKAVTMGFVKNEDGTWSMPQ
jgi:hypothetical protein